MTVVAPVTTTIGVRRSPYQALVPFTEADADWFFGRGDWRDRIANTLKAYRVSVLYGPSGVGKTSVLRAGVEHMLRAEARRNLREFGALELVPVVFSGWSRDDPLAALKAAIHEAVEAISPELAADPPEGTLAEVLDAWGARIEGPVLLVLDQFEEFFLYRDRKDRGRLADELVSALRGREMPVNVLFSIRQDSLAELDRFDGRIPGLLDNLLRIGHLERDAATEAIRRPLERWSSSQAESVSAEDTVVEAVLDQVEAGKVWLDEAGAVSSESPQTTGIEAPYLQLVLTRLWDEERSAGSSVLGLETLERLGGAKAIVSSHLDAALGALPRSQQDVAGRAFRHLVTSSGTKIALRPDDLAYLVDRKPEEVRDVLDMLGGDLRIVRPAGDGRYEIYHDALAGPILAWRTRWEAAQRHRRSVRRALMLAGAAVFLGAIAIVLAVFVVRARHSEQEQVQAQAQTDLLRLREARARVGQAFGTLASDPLTSLSLALSAAHTPKVDAESVLRATLAAPLPDAILHGHRGSVYNAAFSRDGTLFATAGIDGTARIWRVGRQTPLHVLRGHKGRVSGAVFGPSGNLLVTTGADGKAIVWRTSNGTRVRTLHSSFGWMNAAAFSPDGTLLATAEDDGSARIWRTATWRRLRSTESHSSWVAGVAFSPDGTLVVTAGQDGTARIARVATGKTLHVLRGHEGPVNGAAFNRSGALVVTAGSDGTARIWSTRTGKQVRELHGHDGGVNSAAFSPDGSLIVTASSDGTARIWETSSGALIRVVPGHHGRVNSAAFSPDGKLLLTAGLDGTTRLWPAREGAPTSVLPGQHGSVNSIAFSADGERLVTAGDDGVARIWSPGDRNAVRELDVDGPWLYAAAFSPDRSLVVTAGIEGASISSAATGRQVRVLRAGGGALSASFSPDGSLIVTGGTDGTARIWQAETGKLVTKLRGGDNSINGVVISPDGKRVVTAGSGLTARIWQLDSGKPVLVLRGHEDSVNSAAFSPDGRLIATASDDGTARIWNADTGKTVRVLSGHDDSVRSVAFSDDGKLVLTASSDGTARVWLARDGRSILVLTDAVAAAMTPDAAMIATAGRNGTTRLYQCDVCVIPEGQLAPDAERVLDRPGVRAELDGGTG